MALDTKDNAAACIPGDILQTLQNNNLLQIPALTFHISNFTDTFQLPKHKLLSECAVDVTTVLQIRYKTLNTENIFIM